MSTTSTIIDWIQSARSQQAHELLLRGNTPPLIHTPNGTTLLAEALVQPTDVLSFAVQLLKMSSHDTDISRLQTTYLKAQSKKMGNLRAQIFRQRNQIVMVLGLCDGVLPSQEERQITDKMLEVLMKPGLHLISGQRGRLQLFGLIASAAQTAQHHPVVVARGRPYQLPVGASHIEIPFDIPDATSALKILPEIMCSHIGLDLPPSFLGSVEVCALARHRPVWQHVDRPNHTAALKALSNIAPHSTDLLCGGLDDDGYHATRAT